MHMHMHMLRWKCVVIGAAGLDSLVPIISNRLKLSPSKHDFSSNVVCWGRCASDVHET